MANVHVHNILKNYGNCIENNILFYTDTSVGQWKYVQASKFWKLPAQLASTDFGQSFTPVNSVSTTANIWEIMNRAKIEFYGKLVKWLLLYKS